MLSKLSKDKTFYTCLTLAPIFWFILSCFIPINQSFQIGSFIILQSFCWPLVEEIIFRGFIQKYISNKFKANKIAPILLTSILFSFCHLYIHSFLWAGAVFFPSLIFSYFYQKYQSIIPSYLLHAWYNFGLFILF
ncbi:MAG: hypothetical protein COB02_10640 [Candidatus Cloacimonadota bacterium]|nr:MAG: hypothetical protein COB02_10640 [Candidatus Cloacimonadota bacterium]